MLHYFRVLPNDAAGALNLTVTLEAASAERGIRLIVAPVEEDRVLAAERAQIVVSLWCESATIVRGAIRHSRSGSVAYFQGSSALLRIVEALRVRLDVRP
ncbi:MAG: hypothetical protein ACLPYS_19665 [Vulcanimicrobiaceae bacterium]